MLSLNIIIQDDEELYMYNIYLWKALNGNHINHIFW